MHVLIPMPIMYDVLFAVKKLILPDPDGQPVVFAFMKLLLLSLLDSLGKSTFEDTSVVKCKKHTAICSLKEGTSTTNRKKSLMEWSSLEPRTTSS